MSLATARCAHRSRVNVGRARGGIQQRKCTRCGDLENVRVGSCWFFHSWGNAGKARNGQRPQRCRKCAETRLKQIRPCFLVHRYSAWGAVRGRLRCVRCGEAR